MIARQDGDSNTSTRQAPQSWHEQGLATGADCLAAAKALHEFGWAVLPCCPPNHVGVGKKHAEGCKSPGKAPLVTWKQYQTELPTADDLAGWWKHWPNANLWAAMGPVSGVVRLDVDGRQGGEYLAEVSRGDVPDTVEMVTPAGGRGLFYAIPTGFTPRITHQHGDRIHEGLSLLGQGSGTVLPPSVHAGNAEAGIPPGGVYAWVAGRSPLERPPAPMPGWLVEAMRNDGRRNGAVARSVRRANSADADAVLIDHHRNIRLASMAGAMRRQGMGYEAILAGLSAANERQCRPALSEAEVAKVARSIAQYDPEPQAVIRSVLPEADGAPAGPAPGSSTAIILQYFRDRYRPDFRDGTAIHCRDGGYVCMNEACAVPDSALMGRLADATDAPRYKGGGLNLNALPAHFRNWAKVAWGDLLNALPDEDASELGADSTAGEEFTRLVREAMLTEIVLGDVIGKQGVTQTERRSLIDWCVRFAKPGPWKAIRSKKCWCKIADLGGGEIMLKVAVRHELFAQLKADRRLCEMGQNKFTRRAERYGLGTSTRDDRPHGQAAVVLADAFVLDLTAGLPDPDVDACPEG